MPIELSLTRLEAPPQDTGYYVLAIIREVTARDDTPEEVTT